MASRVETIFRWESLLKKEVDNVKVPLVGSGILGDKILASYMGIMINHYNHYKDPY